MKTQKKNKSSVVRRMKDIFRLGGSGDERLFLENIRFSMRDGARVVVQKTKIPGINMKDLIARHKGRYHLVAFFCRLGYKVLDFPCGSGYGSKILEEQGIIYNGMDFSRPSVEYAKKIYDNSRSNFSFGDLCHPQLRPNHYDVISCIEGLEHIEKEFQQPLIRAFKKSLKKNGVLIISSPESQNNRSGPNATNHYHKWELSKKDFLHLLYQEFGERNVELITQMAILSTGLLSRCFYGVCHKYK